MDQGPKVREVRGRQHGQAARNRGPREGTGGGDLLQKVARGRRGRGVPEAKGGAQEAQPLRARGV
jgi:hypothetical protein